MRSLPKERCRVERGSRVELNWTERESPGEGIHSVALNNLK